ncbi:hypothetical protein [Streptomyces decoyicus]|uniref:hypothetical protein n=1 Tax=Streptomyces decoyicus TaxID=249567 RepID=UPI0033A247B1
MRDHAPIIVHQLSATGGRRVTARGQILGLAYSDEGWVEWRGGQAHDWGDT